MLVLTKKSYSSPVKEKGRCTKSINTSYTLMAPFYDALVNMFPTRVNPWKKLLRQALPHIEGPRVLEVSFGTGYLLTQYAGKYETHGIDLNERMVAMTRKKLAKRKIEADIRQGNVETLPYGDESFDTIVNTMAFSAYPDPDRAMSEFCRVLKKGGKLVLIDVNYPKNANRLGNFLTNLWKVTGDMIRDLDALLERHGFEYFDTEIGGCGSFHLYLARKA